MKPMKYNTPKQRLKIYEKALDFFNGKTTAFDWEIDKDGICCILLSWTFQCSYQDEKCPFSTEIDKYFPEFFNYHNGKAFADAKKYNALYYKNRHQWRIKVLTEIIENLKSK